MTENILACNLNAVFPNFLFKLNHFKIFACIWNSYNFITALPTFLRDIIN